MVWQKYYKEEYEGKDHYMPHVSPPEPHTPPPGQETWRLIWVPDAIAGLDMNAMHPAITYGVDKEGQPNTMVLLYPSKKHDTTLGYYQDISLEVRTEEAEKLNVQVVRRGVGIGGGQIFCEIGKIGMAIISCRRNFFKSFEDGFFRWGNAQCDMYHALGVKDPWHRWMGDIKVGPAKITGFGFSVAGEKGDILTGQMVTTLGELDMENIWNKIAIIPPEKFADKAAKTAAAWVTNVERETGRLPGAYEWRAATKLAIEKNLNIKLEFGELSEGERKVYEDNLRLMISEDYVFKYASKRRFAEIPEGYRLGSARVKYRKLAIPYVLIDREGKIAKVMIAGDWYAGPAECFDELEHELVGIDTRDEEAIRKTVSRMWDKPGFEIVMVDKDELTNAILRAIDNAFAREPVWPEYA